MKKRAAKFKVPDVEKDRKLLQAELEKYLDELKAGTIGLDDESLQDPKFQSLYIDYHSKVLAELVKLARILSK